MKGRIINCSAHKDIYFLEANTKSEGRNLENLFASPAGREMFKCKPRSKLKQKLNPTIDFITNKSRQSSPTNSSQQTNCQEKCIPKSSNSTIEDKRKNSIDLYEEAASILGLTCAQTDDCKCIECQCHYFDFEEEIDFPTGNDCVVDLDHSSACSIQ